MFRLILYIFFLLGHSVLGQEKIKMEIGKQYDPPIMGYNANMAHTPSWEDSIFTNALKKLNPKPRFEAKCLKHIPTLSKNQTNSSKSHLTWISVYPGNFINTVNVIKCNKNHQ